MENTSVSQTPLLSPQSTGIVHRLPSLFEVSHSIRVVEVAKKYLEQQMVLLIMQGGDITHIPFHTHPGGLNTYHLAPIKTAWIQGFLPALLWLLTELQTLYPPSVHPSYSRSKLITLARAWQDSFRWMARPSRNHDQGFRFQLSFGKDHHLTGRAEARNVVLEAAESMMDRYSSKLGVFRSWDGKYPGLNDDSGPEDHWMVIIDNMMNLDFLYEATTLTGDPRYAAAATSQADITAQTFIRKDGTTYHVIDFDPHTGTVLSRFTHQGYADESCWARGQAWAIYGYAQCALRTGNERYVETCQRLADVFLARLPESGVPRWDFDAPEPTSYDASAGTIAANGLRMLSTLLARSDPAGSAFYMDRAIKLIDDILRECLAPPASLAETEGDGGAEVGWGDGGWESVLMHSTSTGNPKRGVLMDHGIIYADYYLLEFAVEMLKMEQAGPSRDVYVAPAAVA